MKSTPTFKYSPALNEQILEGLTEILGETRFENLMASLPVEQSPLGLENLGDALGAAYGSQSAAGILVRAGRAAFSRILTQFSAELGFEDLDFRLLAPRRKMYTALTKLADWLNRQGAGEFEVRVEQGCWQWRHRTGFEVQGESNVGLVCAFLLGMLQELTYWVSSGRVHLIREKPNPNGCLLEIEQKPLD
ncbi:hypothetical protein [Bellilinea sp.]|uniref:hypothetical protein n=1 Tax=Bellilinea sp. TaxID=2838785 RepID=UPI002ADD5935|nr:hypothetical protein [Bellilinea sp.]